MDVGGRRPAAAHPPREPEPHAQSRRAAADRGEGRDVGRGMGFAEGHHGRHRQDDGFHAHGQRDLARRAGGRLGAGPAHRRSLRGRLPRLPHEEPQDVLRGRRAVDAEGDAARRRHDADRRQALLRDRPLRGVQARLQRTQLRHRLQGAEGGRLQPRPHLRQRLRPRVPRRRRECRRASPTRT